MDTWETAQPHAAAAGYPTLPTPGSGHLNFPINIPGENAVEGPQHFTTEILGNDNIRPDKGQLHC